MRNLRNIHRSLLKAPPDLITTAAAWDVASDSVISAFGPTKENAVIELKRWNKHAKAFKPIASWDAPCPLPDIECDDILDLHYFSDISTSCLVLVGGDIVVVREEPLASEDKIEIVGSVDAGISAASWSPDEELLAITTRASTLLYMTRDFDNAANITLTTDDLKASNHVSVGWGKKETQFKGKKARALHDPTVPETVDEGILSKFDAKETAISWRGDGAYLAVNSVEPGSRRVIRVYSRDGVLDSVSEPVDCLVGALSWRPVGNLIASVQYRENQALVVFFERSGLRHGQFDIRLSKEELHSWESNIRLRWNVDSTVLAVCFRDRVQLWTMGNYHYYLKQEVFPLAKESSERPMSFVWHPEKPLHFTLSSPTGVQRLAYTSIVSKGPTSSPDDYGVIAVIDGKCLKITPMRLTNIPPPMSLHEITCESNIIDATIAVNPEDTKSVMIAVLHHTGCSLFEWPLVSMAEKQPSLEWTMDPKQEDNLPEKMCLQVAFSGEPSAAKHILVLHTMMEESTVWIANTHGAVVGAITSHDLVVEGIVTNGHRSKARIYLLTDGDRDASGTDLDKSMADFNENNLLDLSVAPIPIARMESIHCGRTVSLNPGEQSPAKKLFFSLSENGSLFVNGTRLIRNCTSFLVTPAHLIFTTSQHLLKFVHMRDSPEELQIPPDTPETDERCRSVERGAKLVTVMPSIFALVMQMPRGNLETIYPRALVLAGIRDSINKRKYKKAFLACRNHRVDMNILHDHLPYQFIASVGLFVEQIQKVEHIDLFLSQLREEDVSKTMYKETSPAGLLDNHADSQQQLAQGASGSKINRICDAFLGALKHQTSTHFQNIITAHVCKNPPDLDAGLSQIAGVRSQNEELMDGAIEHICFLADVNRLFDNALGLFNLELALLVAQQSQKDPKEYLPFLQNLQSQSTLRRQFSIDNHLNRYKKALNHLCEMKAFDEVKTYTVKHGLYLEALDFYRYQEDQLKELMRLYADHLHQEKKFEEAGIAYEYLNDKTSASESYRQAHLWKESLACATLIPLPEPKLHTLCQNLADILTETKDFHSAATIHLSHLTDIPTAARLFCKGYHFADALHAIGLHRRPDLLETVIDVGLVEGMATMTELLVDCKSQLNAQIPRIRELRAKKAEDPLAFWDGDINDGADIPDNVSLAPTDASTAGGGSLFTRYTNRTGTVGTNATRRTSKNRRREERKKARGKKGSVYEEEYLVNSVGRLVERVNAVGGEVERLVVGLMRRGMRERARAVQGAMCEVVGMCRRCVGEVFEVDGGRGGEGDVGGKGAVEDGRPKGGEGVLWDVVEGEKRREAPVVKEFARLALLG